jgi:hypothetical protein
MIMETQKVTQTIKIRNHSSAQDQQPQRPMQPWATPSQAIDTTVACIGRSYCA